MSQNFMAPVLCPVMYKFLALEKPLKCIDFELAPSFAAASLGKSGKISFANVSQS